MDHPVKWLESPDRLSVLPTEILELILQFITLRKDLSSLCRVSRLFNVLAGSVFHKSLLIGSFKDATREVLDPPRRVCNFLFQNIQLTRSHQINEVIFIADQDSLASPSQILCCHRGELPISHDDADLAYRLSERIAENSLRSFRWQLGCCIPSSILGVDGWLVRHQQNLENLVLITIGTCSQSHPIAIEVFGCVKYFTWQSSRNSVYLRSVKDCLGINAAHLERLEINILDWPDYIDHNDPWAPTNHHVTWEGLIIRDVLDKVRTFPALRQLSLCNFDFTYAPEKFARAFVSSSLRKLRLWNCQGADKFLRHVMNSLVDLPLERLELTFTAEDPSPYGMADATHKLLEFCSGLKDLFICWFTLPFSGTPDRFLGRHLETLKRVVVHVRTRAHDILSSYVRVTPDGDVSYWPVYRTLLTNPSCEFVGLQLCPAFHKEHIKPYAKQCTCKILHLRVSGDSFLQRYPFIFSSRRSFDDFANWVFGPDGMPQLLVLAYGDFAFADENAPYNVLYCRNMEAESPDALPYKVLKPSNTFLWEMVRENMDALSACAYEPTIEL